MAETSTIKELKALNFVTKIVPFHTKWGDVVTSHTSSTNQWLNSDLHSVDAKLAREHALTAAVQTMTKHDGAPTVGSKTMAPFRFGPAATDSCATYRMVISASMAGEEMNKASVPSITETARKGHVGRAWRWLADAGEWPGHFDDALRPPQLHPSFKKLVLQTVAIEMYDHYRALPRTELNSRKIIATLFLLDHVGTPHVKAWAAAIREQAILIHWATFHTEPRSNREPNKVTAYCVIRRLMEGMPADAIPREVRQLQELGPTIASVSGGAVDKAMKETKSREHYLKSIRSTDELERFVLPIEILNGDAPPPADVPHVETVPHGDGAPHVVITDDNDKTPPMTLSSARAADKAATAGDNSAKPSRGLFALFSTSKSETPAGSPPPKPASRAASWMAWRPATTAATAAAPAATDFSQLM